MTNEQLYQEWLKVNPAAASQPRSDALNNEFNNWAAGVAAASGVDNFGDISPEMITSFSAANPSSQPQVGGNPFADPTLSGAVDAALLSGATGAQVGGNTQQVQGGTQSGNYNSTGNSTSNQVTGSNQAVTGTTQGTTTGNTTNTNTGTSNQNVTGTNTNVGTNTGFSNLINTGTGTNTNTGTTSNTGQTVNQTAGSTTGNTAGQSTSVGQTNSTGATTNDINSVNTTTGTTGLNTVNNTTGTQTGTQAQTGTNTTKVDDSLGFGALLSGAAGAAGQDDAARRGFLTDMVATGGSGFNSQVEQAVNQSLSGPGMQGVGDSARGRAVSYAVGDVARNNANQRLNAAGQLAGPTALSSLAGAANPYLGSTTSSDVVGSNTVNTAGTIVGSQTGTNTSTNVGQSTNVGTSANNTLTGSQTNDQTASTGTNTGTNYGTSSNTGTNTNVGTNTNTNTQAGTSGGTTSNAGTTNQNSTGSTTNQGTGTQTGSSSGSSNQNTLATGFADLINSETNSGNTVANSLAVAAGNTPMQENSGGGGGCYVSSVLAMRGLVDKEEIRRAVRYKLYTRKDRYMPIGYSLIGPAIARWTERHPWAVDPMLAVVKAVLHEELRLAGERQFKLAPWLTHAVFQGVTSMIGWGASLFGAKCITRDTELKARLEQHNLYFKV